MAQQKPPSSKSATSTHDVDHGHDNRVDELSEERATHQQPLMPWMRPSSLEAPPPRPGMVQRWIRVTLRGEDDPRNLNRKTREGWVPRSVSSIPDEWKSMSSSPQGAQDGVFAVDDLVLCEMPEDIYSQRAAYYSKETQRQMDAVEHDLEKAQVPGYPINRTHKSAVDTSHGRKVQAADD
jgi:hypothetical protein